MSPSEDQLGANFSKPEWISLAIVSLTLLCVIGAFFYNPHYPSYTETFKIISKEFVPKEKWRHASYSNSGRYGAFRPFTTYVPAHYRVNIQWGEDTFSLYVPQEKSYLLSNDKITFTYRITKDGWLRLLGFHDTNAHVNSVEILEFGIFDPDGETLENLTLEKLITRTDQIPAEKGILFGYTFKATGTPLAAYSQLQYENNYPGLKNPDNNEILLQDPFSATVKIGSVNSTFYLEPVPLGRSPHGTGVDREKYNS